MEPESSLPHSQVRATCPYPEPAWSSPQFPGCCCKWTWPIQAPHIPSSKSHVPLSLLMSVLLYILNKWVSVSMRNWQSQKNEFENSCYANRSIYSVGLYYDLGKTIETNVQACTFRFQRHCKLSSFTTIQSLCPDRGKNLTAIFIKN
jgi:hypothetical protein